MIRHRLIAPEGLAPTTIELSGGVELPVPPDGIVEIPHRIDMPGDCGVFEPVDRTIETGWLSQLLGLGFRPLPPAGTSAQRPRAGRYPGELFFDTALGRPLWWSGAGWVGADGLPA